MTTPSTLIFDEPPPEDMAERRAAVYRRNAEHWFSMYAATWKRKIEIEIAHHKLATENAKKIQRLERDLRKAQQDARSLSRQKTDLINALRAKAGAPPYTPRSKP